MKRIGVIGGTFNPVHIGHLAIAQTAQEAMKLQKVIFVPSNWPPHKMDSNIAPAKDRYNMVRLAIKGNPLFEISDFEIKKEGKSYTIDTLWHFRRIFPGDTELFFIIGGDTLPQLKNWKYIDDILKISTFIVVNRPGQFRKTKGIKIDYYSVSMPGIDISSSYVRGRIAQNKNTKYFVADSVLEYIRKHKLYKTK
ncbi:MAG: nicotinate-nucleotide adenylyltransferase [Candidatus Paceibacterales bacterium]